MGWDDETGCRLGMKVTHVVQKKCSQGMSSVTAAFGGL